MCMITTHRKSEILMMHLMARWRHVLQAKPIAGYETSASVRKHAIGFRCSLHGWSTLFNSDFVHRSRLTSGVPRIRGGLIRLIELLLRFFSLDPIVSARGQSRHSVARRHHGKSEANMSKPHIEQEIPDQGGLQRTLKDLFAGAVGGVAQVLLGQPFDIVKVRLQTTSQYSGALDAATKIYQNEGALAFYKGTLTPLIGIGACVSVQFGGFHYARRAFEAQNTAKTGTAQLSYSQYYAAGAFAGIANTVLSSPIEHIRIRLQTQPHGVNRLYAGPIDCVRKLSAHQGVLGGVYRGTAVTFLREAQAYGVWFTTFEYLMNADALRNGIKREEISTLKVAGYGGLAGEMLWISSYPFDVVKSKMQSDSFGAEQKYKSMRDCFAKTYRIEGLGGFWRGIGPTLLRAMPVSAGTFATVEVTMRFIS